MSGTTMGMGSLLSATEGTPDGDSIVDSRLSGNCFGNKRQFCQLHGARSAAPFRKCGIELFSFIGADVG
jgi:hypothetical protein